MGQKEPIKVAIVGGGCAGVSAAFELTSPDKHGLYDVTLYQLGWRLGGKGASSRGVAGRIEEHGLHLWLGFYENAFRQLRECYDELARTPGSCPVSNFDEAFVPDPIVSVAEEDPLGGWDIWSVHFPTNDLRPGEGADETLYSVSEYFIRVTRIVAAVLSSLESGTEDEFAPKNEGSLFQRAESLLALGHLTGLGALQVALQLSSELLPLKSDRALSLTRKLLFRAQTLVGQQLDMAMLGDKRIRRLWPVVDIVVATLRGVIRFDLLHDERGFDAIDDYDWMEWLELNGARKTSVEAPFVRASLYDLTFAYRSGDPKQPAFAAGVALRCAIRWFLTYRGSMFWKMRSGMGETIFAPYYEVLKDRGVKFEFFHGLQHVGLSKDNQGCHVSALHFGVQAEPKNKIYNPLLEVQGQPVWPDTPLFDQLEGLKKAKSRDIDFEDESLVMSCPRRTLRVGADFDMAVLAISKDSAVATCSELIAEFSSWRQMSENVTTVATQAAQLWMKPSMGELGYAGPKGNLSGFVTPFDTWTDMSHLAAVEQWPERPGSIAYFCSALQESQASQSIDGVKATTQEFLKNEMPQLWTHLNDWLDRDDFFSPMSGSKRHNPKPARLRDQYFSANTQGSQRYVQSLPGSIRYRLSPLDREIDNFTVAGDWTENGLNAGCVEAAVMSGMLASHAISGSPALASIVGYNHA